MDASPPDPDSFAVLQTTLKSALLTTTRATNAILSEDLAFHRSLDPSLARSLDKQNVRLLELAGRLLGNVEAGAEAVSDAATPRASAASKATSNNLLVDGEALEANWKGVVDVVDSLLERADMSLSEHTGSLKKGGQEVVNAAAAQSATKKQWPKVLNILKPQRTFEHVPSNTETGPFKPLLTGKPHAITPLEKSLQAKAEADGALKFPHPYQTEIENYKFPPSMYTKADPTPYLPYESTTATLVDTPEALDEMLAELKKANEIAIDLEHHDTRSYIGLVSLMQISTRSRDWIVDTLKPWRRRLERLNEVFADPSILKVLHGSAMDIIWLQRDFGLYVVGMFDTGCAATVLRYPGRGLAYLLARFVNFQAQKQHQLADWRVRPLPQDLFDYARADTHFLLYVYDCMRNELIEQSNFSDPEQDMLQQVLDGSKELQLQRYETPLYDAKTGMGALGWYKQLYRQPALFNKQQFAVFKALHQWRDTVARQEDDSIHFVMTNHAMMAIAREMPDSKEKLVNVTQSQSAAMKQRRGELIALIAQAKAEGENGPEMRDVLRDLDVIANQMRAVERVGQFQNPYKVIPFIPPVPPPPPTIAKRRPTSEDAVAGRSEMSKFWGATLVSGQKRPATVDVRLNLPLPELTAEVFTEGSSNTAVVASSPAVDPGARAEHAFVPAAKRNAPDTDDVFVIKELGGRSKKRKVVDVEPETLRKAAAIASQEEADELPLELPEGESKSERKRRRAEKRAAKVAKATNNGTLQDEDVEAGEEEAPFDYENAPSVLHAQNSKEMREKRRKKGKDRGIDPYKKALDAPKGLPRAHREKAGRSATFSGKGGK